MHLKRKLLSCMTWLQCSYLWYLVFKAYLLSSVRSDIATSVLPCSSHNPCLCSKSNHIWHFLCGYNSLVNHKQQFIVFFWVVPFLGIPIMLLLNPQICLLAVYYYLTNIICSRLVLYVQGSTFMGILYIGL